MTEKTPQPEAPETPVEEPTQTPVDEGSTTVEVDGDKYEVSDAARDDFELMDAVEEMVRRGDVNRAPSIMRGLLGQVQMNTALDRLRDEKTGRVSVDAGWEFVTKLLNGLNPN